MVELVDNFIVSVVRIYRHDGCTKTVERKILYKKLRTVFQQQGDSVAVAVAGF